LKKPCEVDHPLVLLERFAFLLAHLLDQLCARLAARALGCAGNFGWN
jgi:hypothetical protein